MTLRSHFIAFLSVSLLAISMAACQAVADTPGARAESPQGVEVNQKIDGVAFVSPPGQIGPKEVGYVKTSNAGWVQFIPYGFSYPATPEVTFDWGQQWWGERSDGIRSMVRAARGQGLKIMVKPHVWIASQGWAGTFALKNEADWKAWESSYQHYIMTFARLAEEEGVEMFCVGTELKQITIERPDYFGRLADSVRTVFSGLVTYASNWDNYEAIQFWDKMDMVGVDGYFPLLDDDTPEVEALVKAWDGDKKRLQAMSEKYKKPILFVEWGYLSVDKSGWRTWELEANLRERPLNMQAQANCYEAIFQALWDEPWFAGGFAWQWYAHHLEAGGLQDKDHTPQNKPAMEIMKREYGKY